MGIGAKRNFCRRFLPAVPIKTIAAWPPRIASAENHALTLLQAVSRDPLERGEFRLGDRHSEAGRAETHPAAAGAGMKGFHEGPDATVFVGGEHREVVARRDGGETGLQPDGQAPVAPGLCGPRPVIQFCLEIPGVTYVTCPV